MLEESSQTAGDNPEMELAWLRDMGKTLAMIHLFSHLDVPGSALEASLIDSARFGPLAQAMKHELSEKVIVLVDRLAADEAAAAGAVYFEGLTIQDAGQQLGISKSWASRMHAKAIDRLAGMLRK